MTHKMYKLNCLYIFFIMRADIKEVIDEVRVVNTNWCSEKVQEIIGLIEPLRDKMEEAEKCDEAMIVKIYVRKWTDILTQWRAFDRICTTTHSSDHMLMNTFKSKWVSDSDDDEE